MTPVGVIRHIHGRPVRPLRSSVGKSVWSLLTEAELESAKGLSATHPMTGSQLHSFELVSDVDHFAFRLNPGIPIPPLVTPSYKRYDLPFIS